MNKATRITLRLVAKKQRKEKKILIFKRWTAHSYQTQLSKSFFFLFLLDFQIEIQNLSFCFIFPGNQTQLSWKMKSKRKGNAVWHIHSFSSIAKTNERIKEETCSNGVYSANLATGPKSSDTDPIFLSHKAEPSINEVESSAQTKQALAQLIVFLALIKSKRLLDH